MSLCRPRGIAHNIRRGDGKGLINKDSQNSTKSLWLTLKLSESVTSRAHIRNCSTKRVSYLSFQPSACWDLWFIVIQTQYSTRPGRQERHWEQLGHQPAHSYFLDETFLLALSLEFSSSSLISISPHNCTSIDKGAQNHKSRTTQKWTCEVSVFPVLDAPLILHFPAF